MRQPRAWGAGKFFWLSRAPKRPLAWSAIVRVRTLAVLTIIGRISRDVQVSRKSHSLPKIQRSAESFPLSIPHSNLS